MSERFNRLRAVIMPQRVRTMYARSRTRPTNEDGVSSGDERKFSTAEDIWDGDGMTGGAGVDVPAREGEGEEPNEPNEPKVPPVAPP